MEPAGRDSGRAFGAPRSGTSDALFQAEVQSFLDNFFTRWGGDHRFVNFTADMVPFRGYHQAIVQKKSKCGQSSGNTFCQTSSPFTVLDLRDPLSFQVGGLPHWHPLNRGRAENGFVLINPGMHEVSLMLSQANGRQ
jgi:hypothetical protein